MADLSVAQQQELLGEAEILLGAFGTNLLALYHAPPGCTVIAMTDRAELDPVVAHTCSLLNMHHQFLVCAPVPVSNKRLFKKDIDLIVSCRELARRIAEIGAHR